MQTASASAAPQYDPSMYAQYSFAVQVLPARAPQDLAGEPQAPVALTLVPAAAAKQSLS
jgi:hypothetical protein